MIRRTIAGPWAARLALTAALAGNVLWYRLGGAPGEVLSGLGAALVAVGIVSIGAPYLALGAIDRATAGAMSQDQRTTWMPSDPLYLEERRAEWSATRRAVKDERITAAGLILTGTLLNGYGPLIARLLHLRG